jgi:glycosyltransferase involved in cell wall biosynthesis
MFPEAFFSLKVLMVLSGPVGIIAGTDARIRGICEGLRNLHVQVKVVVPSRAAPMQRSTAYARPFFRGRMPLARLWSPLLSSWTALLLKGEVLRAIDSFTPDVIQLEQDTAGLIAPQLRKRIDVPIIMDFHGMKREESIAEGTLSPNSFFDDWLTKRTKSIIKSVDYVTVVSEEMRRYVLEHYGGEESKVRVVPNAAIPRLESRPFKERTNRIVYAGTVHSIENITLLAEALIYAWNRDPGLDIHVSNRGDSFQYLRSQLARARIRANYEWVSEDHFLSYLSESDVGLIPSLNHKWRQMGTPAKLFEYLSAGVPVVATDIGASWNRIIEENKVGFLTENSPEAFGKAILELSRNPELVHEFGNRAISLVRRELNYNASALKLLDLYAER